MIGEKIREVRQSQGRSLAEIAKKASISVATLSRIETDKQSIDVELLLVLARVLGIEAGDLIGSDGNGQHDGRHRLVQKIAGLEPTRRAELWRDLAAERRVQRAQNRPTARNLGTQVEELLAQMEFMREELEAVRGRLKKSR